MAVCSQCGSALSCPDHGVHLVEGVVEPCPQLKLGVIWVEVVDDQGSSVDGVEIEVAGAPRTTSGGFAQSDPLAVGSAYVATIKGPLPASHADTHALPLAVERTGISVQNGQIKLVDFRLRAIVNPVITIAKKAVVCGGPRQSVALKADKVFSGSGKLTCVSGGDKVTFWQGSKQLTSTTGEFEFTGLGQSGVTLEVEATDFSDVDGVELQWELASDSDAVGAAVSDKMTAVKATLDIHDNAGTALAPDVRKGDGRVVILQNADKSHKRAKLTLKCEPAAYVGTLVLSAIDDRVSLFDADADGAEQSLPLEVAVGASAPAPLFVQGSTVSAAKSDTGFKLAVKDLADDVDKAVVTVVDARLDVYLARTTPTADPALMSSAAKKEPGRLLVRQDAKFRRERAKLVLVKLPKDAPCKLQLKAASDKVILFEAGNEKHQDSETAVSLPKDVGATDIADDAGITFWAEGADISTLMECSFDLDVESVEDACDQAFFSVVDLRRANGTDPAPRLLPVKNLITDASPVQDHIDKVKLIHNLGTCTFTWSCAGTKFALANVTTDTVTLTAGAAPSDSPNAEELKLVITPDGKRAFPALMHPMGVVQILFKQDTTYAGGYDKYEVINYVRQDGSADTFDPPEKYDFVAIEKSSTGQVIVEYKGAEKEDIFFVSRDAGVTAPKKDSPDGSSPYTLELDGQAQDQAETVLEARIESAGGRIVNLLGTVVLKMHDMEAEFFRVHDSSNGSTMPSHTPTGPDITAHLREHFAAAISTLTITDGGLVDENYDIDPTNGKLDMEPGTVTTEQNLIDQACVSTKARVVYVKKLQWSYYFTVDAPAGQAYFYLRTYHPTYIGYIGIGNSYLLVSRAGHSEVVTVNFVRAVDATIGITAPLVNSYNVADGAALIWPLGGLSGNPAWVQEGAGGLNELMDVVGHELGHQLATFKDVCEKANLMYGVNDRTALRLRHREMDRLYPGSGTEKQWFQIPR